MATPALKDRATVYIYLDRKDKEQLEAIAARRGLTMSSIIRSEVIDRIIAMREDLWPDGKDIES